MKEVQFILPVLAGSNHIDQGIEKFERKIAERFGGFTATPSRGGWVNDLGDLVMDANITYTVAIDEFSAEDRYDIAAMAVARATALLEDALYFKDVNGEVSIIDIGVNS